MDKSAVRQRVTRRDATSRRTNPILAGFWKRDRQILVPSAGWNGLVNLEDLGTNRLLEMWRRAIFDCEIMCVEFTGSCCPE